MDEDTKTLIAMKIGEIMEVVDDPDDLLAIVATCLHIWSNEHGADITALGSILLDAIVEANGLEIEGEGDNDT